MAEIGKDVSKAKALLEQGELVAIPTETVYGLAGNALDVNAVTKIFKVKDRPYFDPLIVHVADLNSAHNLVETIPAKAEKLANKFWPGPLTILLKRKNIIPDLVTAGLETVGIRCPDHSLTNELLRSLKFPLAAPSANPFGYVSPTNPDHVNEQLGDKIKYILDGGECKVGIESTIVGYENDEPIIYRLGGLSVEQIESVIGKATVQLNASSNPQAPGQLKSHYAPRKKLILESLSISIKKYQSNKVGVLCYKEKVIGIDPKNQRILSPTGSLEMAAQHLFSALRELDKLDIEFILAEEVLDEGIGRAINDRLRRASAVDG
jgi:L-threonylcarbamoyladenylate synthase